jgi:hypothetical protein
MSGPAIHNACVLHLNPLHLAIILCIENKRYKFIFDFTLSPCFDCRMISSGLFSGVCSFNTNVLEHSVPSSQASRYVHTQLPMEMEHTECSETLANNTKESIRHIFISSSLNIFAKHASWDLVLSHSNAYNIYIIWCRTFNTQYWLQCAIMYFPWFIEGSLHPKQY